MLNATAFFLFSGSIYLVYLIYSVTKKNFSLQRHIISLLWLIYVNAVVAITLFPIPVDHRVIEYSIKNNYQSNYNFIPFSFINDLSGSTLQLRPILGNIILLMPFGYLAPLAFKRLNSFWKLTLAGFIFSVGIETSQLLISLILGFRYRSIDIDDLILNTTGAVVGYFLLILMIPVIEKFFDITLEKKPPFKERFANAIFR